MLVADIARAVDRRPHLSGHPDATTLLRLVEEEYAEEAGPDRMSVLADRFGLSDLDVAMITIAVAPDLDLRFGALYGLLHGSDRWAPSVSLTLELCGVGSLSGPARARLGVDAPLVRHSLVAVDPTGPALLRTITVAERVTAYLLGDDSTDARVAGLLVDGPARADEVAGLMARGFRSRARVAHVRARTGTTGLASARGAMEQMGLTALVVDLSRINAIDDRARLTGIAVREAVLADAGLVLTGVDAHLMADRQVLTAVEGAPVPVAIVDDLTWPSEWYREPLLTVDATALAIGERAEMWREAVDEGDHDLSGVEWLNLVGLRMTPEHIAVATESAATIAAAAGVPVSVGHLHDAAREQGRLRLDSAGVRTVPRATLDDLVLPASTRQSLEELVSWARNREALLTSGRLTGRGTKGHGLTAMFAGTAGTGKTLAAEAIAGELGLELCTVDLSLVVDKFIGETEKHLEQLISEAENLNVVLFFDEADALFGSRSAVTDSRDRYANQEVAYLLQRIERFEGLAVLATNLRGNLDPAFTRRLHHIITFTDPDADTRRALWDAHLAEVVALDAADPLDHDWLAGSVELAGGDIRNIVMTAAFAAAAEQNVGLSTPRPAPVGMRHVLYAVEREYRKQAKRMPAAP